MDTFFWGKTNHNRSLQRALWMQSGAKFLEVEEIKRSAEQAKMCSAQLHSKTNMINWHLAQVRVQCTANASASSGTVTSSRSSMHADRQSPRLFWITDAYPHLTPKDSLGYNMIVFLHSWASLGWTILKKLQDLKTREFCLFSIFIYLSFVYFIFLFFPRYPSFSFSSLFSSVSFP
jgi:hypothetical protein